MHNPFSHKDNIIHSSLLDAQSITDRYGNDTYGTKSTTMPRSQSGQPNYLTLNLTAQYIFLRLVCASALVSLALAFGLSEVSSLVYPFTFTALPLVHHVIR